MHPPLPPAHLSLQRRSGVAEMVPGPAAEWFVLFTLATLFLILGAFAIWMWLLWRRAQNPPPHVRLLMEMQDEEDGRETMRGMPAGPGHEEGPGRRPWERSSDWWKKEE